MTTGTVFIDVGFPRFSVLLTSVKEFQCFSLRIDEVFFQSEDLHAFAFDFLEIQGFALA